MFKSASNVWVCRLLWVCTMLKRFSIGPLGKLAAAFIGRFGYRCHIQCCSLKQRRPEPRSFYLSVSDRTTVSCGTSCQASSCWPSTDLIQLINDWLVSTHWIPKFEIFRDFPQFCRHFRIVSCRGPVSPVFTARTHPHISFAAAWHLQIIISGLYTMIWRRAAWRWSSMYS
jgi:hypothetical protein